MGTSMAEPGNKELEALIPLINKLQDVSSQMEEIFFLEEVGSSQEDRWF